MTGVSQGYRQIRLNDSRALSEAISVLFGTRSRTVLDWLTISTPSAAHPFLCDLNLNRLERVSPGDPCNLDPDAICARLDQLMQIGDTSILDPGLGADRASHAVYHRGVNKRGERST
jgi:hypothetical protein